MRKRVVFVTGEKIGTNAFESIHLYKRIASFKKCANVTIITQSHDRLPEQAGCEQVIHIGESLDSQTDVYLMTMQADMLVFVGLAPNINPSATLLGMTSPKCCIVVINQDCLDLPRGFHREKVLKMRDMSISSGLLFLSVYQWMMDLVEK